MDSQSLVIKITKIFFDQNINDDDVANEILELMDENKVTVQLDAALNAAYRLLNTWSRTEMDTGFYLDEVHEILQLRK